eukprot:1196123-Prorocentrum_minimum.AAC.9
MRASLLRGCGGTRHSSALPAVRARVAARAAASARGGPFGAPVGGAGGAEPEPHGGAPLAGGGGHAGGAGAAAQCAQRRPQPLRDGRAGGHLSGPAATPDPSSRGPRIKNRPLPARGGWGVRCSHPSTALALGSAAIWVAGCRRRPGRCDANPEHVDPESTGRRQFVQKGSTTQQFAEMHF